MYRYADVRFNNGNGALVCNGCSVILAKGHHHENRLHFCDRCTELLTANMKDLRHHIRDWKNREPGEHGNKDFDMWFDKNK